MVRQSSIMIRASTSACLKAALSVLLVGCAGRNQARLPPLVRNDEVGKIAANRFVTPTGQILTPIGRQVGLPGMRPQALALSPDGRLLATSGRRDALVLIDPVAGAVLQTVPLTVIDKQPGTNSTPTITNSVAGNTVTNAAELSFTGLVFSPDSRRLYLSNAGGNIWMFVLNDGWIEGGPRVLSIPDAQAPKRKREIPTGLAVS